MAKTWADRVRDAIETAPEEVVCRVFGMRSAAEIAEDEGEEEAEDE